MGCLGALSCRSMLFDQRETLAFLRLAWQHGKKEFFEKCTFFVVILLLLRNES